MVGSIGVQWRGGNMCCRKWEVDVSAHIFGHLRPAGPTGRKGLEQSP